MPVSKWQKGKDVVSDAFPQERRQQYTRPRTKSIWESPTSCLNLEFERRKGKAVIHSTHKVIRVYSTDWPHSLSRFRGFRICTRIKVIKRRIRASPPAPKGGPKWLYKLADPTEHVNRCLSIPSSPSLFFPPCHLLRPPVALPQTNLPPISGLPDPRISGNRNGSLTISQISPGRWSWSRTPITKLARIRQRYPYLDRSRGLADNRATQALLYHNATVYVASSNIPKAEHTVTELKNETGKNPIFLHLDLGDRGNCQSAAQVFLR